ncbi:MAG: PilZ domain-containing protein [Azoarcus sp.]|nr:PilZ domain-containing protein [Azoarcus sp.]
MPSTPLPSPPPPLADDSGERRVHQRFVARRQGEACFWAHIGDARLALNDLSLKGFSVPATSNLVRGMQFDFTLRRDGVPDAIQGHGEVVNHLGQADAASAGCRIIGFDGDGAERLQEWLVTHVICSATVRISEKDAMAIVSGHSLV